jgi:hypothetical protein
LTDVSIVIPTHERFVFLREAVRSARAQDGDPEIIVVRSNGDSAAGELESEFPRINVLECDGERAAARNAGCRAATADWVLFLDDDDLLLPGALSSLLGAARAQRADVIRGARVEFEGEAPPRPPVEASATAWLLERDDLITGAEILTPSQTLIRRAVLPPGPFEEDFVPVEDYALGATLALRGARVLATSAKTTAYRRHPGQSVGSALSARALGRRRAVLDEMNHQLSRERRLRRRARGHHELYLRMPAELSRGRRGRALGAVLCAGAWSPALLRHSMWWRAGAHVILRGAKRS